MSSVIEVLVDYGADPDVEEWQVVLEELVVVDDNLEVEAVEPAPVVQQGEGVKQGD